MPLTFRINEPVEPAAAADLYQIAGLRRPVDDLDRIGRMFAHANLTIAAWDGERLVGVARALCDFAHICYLADLAVDPDYQGQGLGRELIARVRAEAGPQCSLLLLSAPGAMTYYPHIGMAPAENAFLTLREE